LLFDLHRSRGSKLTVLDKRLRKLFILVNIFQISNFAVVYSESTELIYFFNVYFREFFRHF